MTFTYTPLVTDRDKVRFHIGDTDENAFIFSDEEIVAIISMAGSWQAAVITCLRNIIARLAATPSFSADWLRIDPAGAIKTYQSLLVQKQSELELDTGGGLESGVVHIYRADSDMSEEPYTE